MKHQRSNIFHMIECNLTAANDDQNNRLTQYIKVAVLSIESINAVVTKADSFQLSETQVEKLNCKQAICSKTSKGSYKATLAIGSDTLLSLPALLNEFGVTQALADTGIDFSKGFNLSKMTFGQIRSLSTIMKKVSIAPETPFSLQIGEYLFSSTFGDRKNLKKQTTATWQTYAKKPGYSGLCPGNENCVKDRTVKSVIGITGINIKISGKSDHAHDLGQSIFADTCTRLTPPVFTPSSLLTTQSAILTIGATTITLPVKVNCSVKRKPDPVDVSGGPYNTVNLKITAKL